MTTWSARDIALVGGVGIAAAWSLYLIARHGLAAAPAAAVDALFNAAERVETRAEQLAGTQGTVYEGYGLVGSASAIANRASGGTFQSIGEWIGGKVADLRGF